MFYAASNKGKARQVFYAASNNLCLCAFVSVTLLPTPFFASSFVLHHSFLVRKDTIELLFYFHLSPVLFLFRSWIVTLITALILAVSYTKRLFLSSSASVFFHSRKQNDNYNRTLYPLILCW